MFPSALKELKEDPYLTSLKLFRKKSSVRKVIMDYAEYISLLIQWNMCPKIV